MRRFFLLIFSLVIILSVGFSARAYSNPGKPTGFVNDYAQIILPDTRQALEDKLVQFEKDTSNEISVVTIKNLQGYTVDNFARNYLRNGG